jgi:predicted lipid-binding transport protein (Tim44 family)
MNETETGSSLLPVIILAIYWAYLLVWYEGRKEDGQGTTLFNSGLPPPAAGTTIQRLGNPENGASTAERDFDETSFMNGARSAYEFILKSFAAGDMEDLRDLLAPEVFQVFSEEAARRTHETGPTELQFVSLERADIVDKEFGPVAAMVKVRFESEIFVSSTTVPANAAEQPPSLLHALDLWTFRREHASKTPVWMLMATDTE